MSAPPMTLGEEAMEVVRRYTDHSEMSNRLALIGVNISRHAPS